MASLLGINDLAVQELSGRLVSSFGDVCATLRPSPRDLVIFTTGDLPAERKEEIGIFVADRTPDLKVQFVPRQPDGSLVLKF